MTIGTPEILVCLVVALIVLGPEQLPRAARQIGKAVAEFKRFSGNMQAQVTDMINADEKEAEASKAREETGAPNPVNPDVSGFRLIDDKPQPSEPSTEARHFRNDGQD